MAGVGCGVFADEISAVKQCLKLDRTLTPIPAHAEFYARRFAQYRKLHDVLADAYKEING